MNKLKSKWVLIAVLATTFVAGCGGGSDDTTVSAVPATSPAIAALVTQYSELVATANEASDPITNVDMLALASDESSDPVQIN